MSDIRIVRDYLGAVRRKMLTIGLPAVLDDLDDLDDDGAPRTTSTVRPQR